MIQRKSLAIVLTLASIVALSTGSVAVYAEGGISGGTSGSGSHDGTTTTEVDTDTPPRTTTSSAPSQESPGTQIETHESGHVSGKKVKKIEKKTDKTEAAEAPEAKNETDDRRTKLHTEGAELLSKLRADKTDKTAEQKQKNCEARQQGMVKKFSGIKTLSTRNQARIDGIFAKAQAYQVSKNIQAPNYVTLVASAQAAQASSASALSDLQAMSPVVDCTKTDATAMSVADFKAAAQQARTKLKAYRDSVKAVLGALEAASPSDETTSPATTITPTTQRTN